jgi:hypothetical protein
VGVGIVGKRPGAEFVTPLGLHSRWVEWGGRVGRLEPEEEGRAMFVVWGHNYELTPLGDVPLDCPKCKRSPMQLNTAKKKFTLYWLPLWTMEETHALKCKHCNDDSIYRSRRTWRRT